MKEYRVFIDGIEHTMLLSDDDAKAKGLTPDKPATKAAEAPANKGASASANKTKT